MSYKIEKNIPLPKVIARGRKAAPPKYPFDQMEVGDSFVCEANGQRSANYYKVKTPGWDYVQARVSETHIRIWRIA